MTNDHFLTALPFGGVLLSSLTRFLQGKYQTLASS